MVLYALRLPETAPPFVVVTSTVYDVGDDELVERVVGDAPLRALSTADFVKVISPPDTV